jgi:hypothetical protein
VTAICKNYLNNILIEVNPFEKQALEMRFDDKDDIVFDFKSNKIGKK